MVNTFEIISKYILKNNYFETEEKIDTDLNRALSQVEMKNGQMRAKKVDTSGFLSSVIQKQYMKGIGRKKLSKAFSKIIAKYTKGKKKKSAIKTLKNNKDLNNILGNIDDLAKEKGVQLLDRENLEFTIERKQLDKLKTKIKDNFTVKFSYQLLQ